MTGTPPDNGPSRQPVEYVQVGTVVGTHGTDGRLRVEPETDNPERFAQGGKLLIAGERFTVQHVTHAAGGGILLVELEELTSREEAAKLRHQQILVEPDETPELPEDTYYHYQLLDMQVVDVHGNELGTLTEVIETGANDVYVVSAEDTELMVPALTDVVVEINVEQGRMTVDLPEGIEPRSTTPKPKRHPPRRRARRPRPKSDGATGGG